MLRSVIHVCRHQLVNNAFKGIITCDSLLTHRLASLIQRAIQIIGETDGVILVEFVAGPQLSTHLGVPKAVGCILADTDMIAVGIRVGCNGIVLAMISIGKLQRAEDLQPFCAILHRGIVVGRPLFVILHLAVCLHTHALALWTDGFDADDGTDLGIVLGTGRRDDVHALDVSRFQLFQFPCVLHLLIVDVDFWRSFCENGKIAVLALYPWQHREHIVSRTHVLQQRVLDIDGHATSRHLVLWSITLHRHFTQHLRVGQHLNVAHVALRCVDIPCYISHARYFQQAFFFCTNFECTISFSRYT